MRFSLSILSKNQKGFTLVEVIITLIIFTIGMLAVTRMQLTSIQGNNFSHSINTGGILAARELEQLKNVNYDLITSSTDTTAKFHVDEMGQLAPDDELAFDVTWVVTGRTIPDTSGEAIYKEIAVTVRWRDTQEHSITVIGYATPNRSSSLPTILSTGS